MIPSTDGNRYLWIRKFEYDFGKDAFEKIVQYLSFLLERYSSATSIGFYDGLNLLSSTQIAEEGPAITDRLLHKFKQVCDDTGTIHPARRVRAWLLWDKDTSGAPLLTVQQAAIVRKWRFKNPAPYAAIRQGKDGVGPLPRRDDIRLRQEIDRPSDELRLFGQLTDRQIRAVIALIRRFGARPTQLCYSKVEDLRVWEHAGRRVGVLMIPDVKDGEAPRAHFRERRLSPDLLEMIADAMLDRPSEAVGNWLFCRRTPLATLPEGAPPEEGWRARSLRP